MLLAFVRLGFYPWFCYCTSHPKKGGRGLPCVYPSKETKNWMQLDNRMRNDPVTAEVVGARQHGNLTIIPSRLIPSFDKLLFHGLLNPNPDIWE
jgi:hypothetical protein